MRGKQAIDGATFVAANGYTYRKVDGEWIAVHRHAMEVKLGRKLLKGERVRFIDGDRNNIHPDNLSLIASSKTRRIEYVKEQIRRYQEELAELIEERQ